MKNKIITRIVGGIGNQLFCYAAARRLALVNGDELVIDDVTGFVRDKHYRRKYQLNRFKIPARKATTYERLEPFSRVRRYVKRGCNSIFPFEKRSYIKQEGNDFDPRLLLIRTRGNTYLEGYWQSEQYFKDIEDILRQDLEIIPPRDAININMAREIKNRMSVALHVRYFDSPGITGINNISEAYYDRAVRLIEAQEPSVHFYIFSDHPDQAASLIPVRSNRRTLVIHNKGDSNAYADLWLMSQCKHSIIANSTFSWWGAWLADYSKKIVVAPGNKLAEVSRITSWGFPGQLPEDWIKL